MQSDIYNIATDVSRSVKLSCTPVCLADLPDWLVSHPKIFPIASIPSVNVRLRGTARLRSRRQCLAFLGYVIDDAGLLCCLRTFGDRFGEKVRRGSSRVDAKVLLRVGLGLISLINATGGVMLEYYMFVVTWIAITIRGWIFM
jgi:hypothetical protein